MTCLVSGSVAFDTITTFPGRFAEQILPQQIHILNVSFLVPTLRREDGGCAGNIAYSLRQLGSEVAVLAAIGEDGLAYRQRMADQGVDVSALQVIEGSYTAQAIIITDADNNQITAFHPGAMQQAHEIALPAHGDIRLALIGPDGREAMQRRAADLQAAGIPFIFDPGQGLPMFDGAELRSFIDRATWLAVNDYEGQMLCERTGLDFAALSRTHLQGVVVTLAAQGCEVWVGGERTHVPAEVPRAVVDPTGCGDAFRAGLLHGLEHGWPLVRCAALGNRLGALKIAERGGQNHRFGAEVLAGL